MIKTPWDYQLTESDKSVAILRKYNITYLAWEERTGKTVTTLLTAEKAIQGARVLIVTKINPMKDWAKTLVEFGHLLTNEYVLINYHSVHTVEGKFNLAILDEPHSYIASYPKPSTIWTKVRKKVWGLPLIYSSATPNAQGAQQLFHQLALSKWSPFRQFENFYEFFREFAERDKDGRLPIIRISAERQATDYNKVDNKRVWEAVQHLFTTKTRKELGFEHEPEDELHFVDLDQSTKDIYNIIMEDNILEFTHGETNRDYTLVCDSPIKLRWALHMLEGGVLKIDGQYLDLGNQEKIRYIEQTWGDSEDLVIMYMYKADLIKLRKVFKKAKLLQATTYAEGIDLSMHKHLVIYSQNFSTAQHTQRRARQANKHREEEIKVHYILVKKGISEQVYKTVSINKKNFVDSVFEKEKL